MQQKAPKPKKCKSPECRQLFTPQNSMQTVCHYKCGLVIAAIARKRKEAQLEREDKRQTRERREKLKTYGDHVADAEKALRDFRRLEELSLGSGCMSCGASQEEVRAAQGWKIGGAFDAGHWMGKGARPELRLEPLNLWLQCKACNGGSAKYARKGESVKEGFEAGVIARIGLEAAMALKHDHRPRHYTVDQLKEITREYRAKTRELKRQLDK
jgi:hypothetical protein